MLACMYANEKGLTHNTVYNDNWGDLVSQMKEHKYIWQAQDWTQFVIAIGHQTIALFDGGWVSD